MMNSNYFSEFLNSLKLDVLDTKIASKAKELSDSMCGRNRKLLFDVDVNVLTKEKKVSGVKMTCASVDGMAPTIRQFNTRNNYNRKKPQEVLPECASCLFHLQHANDRYLKSTTAPDPREVALGKALENTRTSRFKAEALKMIQESDGINSVANLMEDMYEYLYNVGGPIPA